MPIHDWTRVNRSLFRAFHQRWVGALCDAMNTEALPEGHFALIEPAARAPVPDILGPPPSSDQSESAAPDDMTRITVPDADRVAVRGQDGRLVAVVEILSPGDKATDDALRAVVERASKLIVGGIHLLIVDLFPPTEKAPQGIHKAIWDNLEELDFELPVDRPLIAASYDCAPLPVSYVEPMAVGESLPEMPLFLRRDAYIPTPLEASYRASWDLFPNAPKEPLQS